MVGHRMEGCYGVHNVVSEVGDRQSDKVGYRR